MFNRQSHLLLSQHEEVDKTKTFLWNKLSNVLTWWKRNPPNDQNNMFWLPESCSSGSALQLHDLIPDVTRGLPEKSEVKDVFREFVGFKLQKKKKAKAEDSQRSGHTWTIEGGEDQIKLLPCLSDFHQSWGWNWSWQFAFLRTCLLSIRKWEVWASDGRGSVFWEILLLRL